MAKMRRVIDFGSHNIRYVICISEIRTIIDITEISFAFGTFVGNQRLTTIGIMVECN